VLVVARLVKRVRALAVERGCERDAKRALFSCPFFGARNESRPDTLTPRFLLDDDVQRVKEKNGHHSDDIPFLIFGDENRTARTRVYVFEAFRYLTGTCGIPKLVEQDAKCLGVFRRCLSDFERVHPAPSIPQRSL